MKPIRLFSTSMAFLAEFDLYSSCWFQRSWNHVGQFEFKINRYMPKVNLLNKNYKIMLNNQSNKVGIIDEIEWMVNENGKGSEVITVRGHELKNLMTRRIIEPLSGQSSYTYTTAAETIAKNLVSSQAGPTADADRQIPYLKIATDQGRGGNYTIDEKYTKTVDLALKDMSLATGLGWIIQFNLGDTLNPYLFEILEGDDLSNKVHFTLENDMLREASYRDTNLAYINVAVVGGSGVGAARIIRKVGTTTGESRVESFVDAPSISVNSDLDNLGTQNLVQYGVQKYVKAQPLLKAPQAYETAWDLGDIVEVSVFDQILYPRIVGIKEIIEPNKFNLELTFDREYPDYYKLNNQKIANIGKSLNNKES